MTIPLEVKCISGLSVNHCGEVSICLWCYDGILERYGTICSGFLHSELDGRVHWVDVPEEFIFVWLVLHHKGIINTTLTYPWGGSVQLSWLCAQKAPCRWWPQLDSQVSPWQLLLFAQRTGLGTGNWCCFDRSPASIWCCWLTWWFCLGVQYPVQAYSWWYLFQMTLGLLWTKQLYHKMWYIPPSFNLVFLTSSTVFCAVDMVDGFANKGFENSS